MRHAELSPDYCPHCDARWHQRSGTVLVGWDNTHHPPCRVYWCRKCGQPTHVLESQHGWIE